MQQTSNGADGSSSNSKSKSRRTRYQPRWLYGAALALFAISATFAVADDMCLSWLANLNDFLSGPSPIKWLSRSEALAASARSQKPILYVALAKGDFNSIRLVGEGLHDQAVAKLINDNYLPVRIDFDPQKHGDDIKQYADRFFMNNAATLAVVPSSMVHAKQQDLMSSSNPVELGISDLSLLERGEFYNNQFYYGGCCGDYVAPGHMARRGPVLNGFKSKQDLVDFLGTAMLWHKLPPTQGKVAWQPLSSLDKPIGTKKRLLVFVEDYGATSDLMRTQLFWNARSYKYINENFEPILLQFNVDNPSKDPARLHKLEEQYGITTMPALVVDDGKNPPAVQFSHTNLESSMSFLQQNMNTATDASAQNPVPSGRSLKGAFAHGHRHR